MKSSDSNTALIRSTTWGDRIAITVSMLCAIHCLLLPILLVALPALSTTIIADEVVHLVLVVVAIPFSLFALTLGCKLHQRKSFIAIGVFGLVLMLLALVSENLGFWHDAERVLTLSGALVVAFAHLRNFKLCRQVEDCSCS